MYVLGILFAVTAVDVARGSVVAQGDAHRYETWLYGGAKVEPINPATRITTIEVDDDIDYGTLVDHLLEETRAKSLTRSLSRSFIMKGTSGMQVASNLTY